MGQIDITDILADPDMVDPMVIARREAWVDEYGQNQIRENPFQTYGCIQPVSGKTLQRIPEAFRVANVMSFWVQGSIVTDGRGKYPDILIYKGQRYAVQMVFDWTAWGAGWSEGTAVREKPTA